MNYIYLLTIVPIDDTTACLTNVVGQKNKDNIFTTVGKYEGFNFYNTPERLEIISGEYNGKLYTITKIGGFAFSHCRHLKEIIIGKDVLSIEWNMYDCVSLQNIFVDKLNKVYQDKDGVLYKDKELVAFPQGRIGQYIIPHGTKRIGNHAFKSSAISEIVIPEGVEEIGINAFYECRSLKEIVLPNSIKKVSSNNNTKNRPIEQTFYLASDNDRKNPLTINDIIKIFPE